MRLRESVPEPAPCVVSCSHVAVHSRVLCGLFLACGALRGVTYTEARASADRLRTYAGSTPRRTVGEEEDAWEKTATDNRVRRVSGLSLCLCVRTVLGERRAETRRAVARERTRACTVRGVVQSRSGPLSCPVWSLFSVRGAARCHVRRRPAPPSPKGVTPAAAAPHAVDPPGALVQRRSRALRLYPSPIPWARVVRACHSLLARHPG